MPYLQLTSAYVDDLKIHDVADPAMVYALRSVKRTATPRRRDYEHAARHGITDRTKFYGAQVLDLAGYATGPDDASTQNNYEELESRFTLPGPHTFRFRRLGRTEDEQVTFTVAAGPDAPSEGYSRTVRWAASIVGADPRIYSATLKGGSYDPTASIAGGGLVMPIAMPLVFTTTTTSELIVQNQGKAPTPPIFTIHGPVDQPIIDNDTTLESIYLLANLGTADTIVVDVAARSVKLNGAERKDLFDSTRSTWFELPKGQNALRLRGNNMAVGVTSLGVAFRDARL